MPYSEFIGYLQTSSKNNIKFDVSVQIYIIAIRTLHDCPSQMNENLLISNSKLDSDSELIWWR